MSIPERRVPFASSQPMRHPRETPITGQEPKPVLASNSVYSQQTNVLTNAPTDGSNEGVETPVGRVWAEARSVTTSDAAASVEVTLTATQKGVRATVRSRAAGTTIAGGSVRFWVQNHLTKNWALGNVDEALPTGAREVATTDQFITVGA